MSKIVSFVGGVQGPWKVVRIENVVGKPLEPVEKIQIVDGSIEIPSFNTNWILRGVTSNLRYTTSQEKEHLNKHSPTLGRKEDTCAALIPIKKSVEWWELAQDERREILEEQSQHIKLGLRYLPAIARRLHHSRDLGEPFDFVTWFEYSPDYSREFEELVSSLRTTLEWKYVEREVDIRLVLD
ncbi:chlorite dismutase [Salipaludibacillus neizhouensis]|uniref:hydrogen peroxide-dependent heme synthase n=1 Tax=Salipaludibacillus neizhouensis TaxID=885475 RepID=A0A3A9K4L3_9BACI|nr:chlorite dismutase family protein [Salipaludibacillus neizhouensis]RKL65810.1 chlorite dismutase [Salipaludibacillus neizhouensis]